MAEMEYKRSGYRIKNCAIDFMRVGYDLSNEEEWWDVMGRDILLKSTFLYCDFYKMISSSATPRRQKKLLSNLATTLLSSFQELENAVRLGSFASACEGYKKVCVILEDVIALMP